MPQTPRATKPQRRWWHLVLVVSGGLLPCIWICLRLLSLSDGTLVLPTVAGSAVVIDRVYGTDPDLKQDDRVKAVDGTTLDDWVAGRHPEVHRADGDVLQYTVERGNVEFIIDVNITPYPIGDLLLTHAVLLGLVIVLYAMTVGVFLARPFDPAATAMLTVGLALPWVVTEFPLGIQVLDLAGGGGIGTYFIGDLGACVFWGAILHFVFVFPEPSAMLRRRPWLILGCYLLPFLLYLLSLTWLARSNSAVDQLLQRVTISGTASYVVPVLALVGMLLTYLRNSDPDLRRRIRWIAASFAFGMIAYVVLGRLPEAVFDQPIVPYELLLLAFSGALFAVAAAILRYRLFDIEVILTRSLLVGGLTVAVLGVYAAVVLGARNDLPFIGTPSTLTALLIGGAAAGLAFSVRKQLSRWVTSLVYGQRNDPHAIVERLSRLDTAAEADQVLPEVVQTLALALRLPYVRLELRGPDGIVEAQAQFGKRTRTPAILPIGSEPEILGQLELDVGPGREPFGPADRRLLDDLSHHLADACRTVLLARALQRSRERIILAREEERRRLRRDLHDGVGPTLAALSMQLEVASGMIRRDSDAAVRIVDQLGSAARGLIGDIRHIVDDLRPAALDELGLVGAIRQHVETFDVFSSEDPDGFSVEVAATGDLAELPAAVEVAAFRIATEAVTNAARYSQGRVCTVTLCRNGDLTMDISDDGRGLQPRVFGSGVGMGSMRERAAELGGDCLITSRSDGPGTRVQVRLPLRGPGRLT
jgi:signal transduction histidine kinase